MPKRKDEAALDRKAVIRVIDDPTTIDAAAWNALVEAQPSATPFVRHEYLCALYASDSAVRKSGWAPQFLVIEEEGSSRIRAACPLYLKSHSYGEYMFLCSIVSMSM